MEKVQKVVGISKNDFEQLQQHMNELLSQSIYVETKSKAGDAVETSITPVILI